MINDAFTLSTFDVWAWLAIVLLTGLLCGLRAVYVGLRKMFGKGELR